MTGSAGERPLPSSSASLQANSPTSSATATTAAPMPSRGGSSSAPAPTLNISMSAMPVPAAGIACMARMPKNRSLATPASATPRGSTRRPDRNSSRAMNR